MKTSIFKKSAWVLAWSSFILCFSLASFLFVSFIYNYFFSKSLIFSSIISSDTSVSCQNSNKKDRLKSIVRVLIVDGGGVDGIMPLVVFQYLEKKSGRPISSLFDTFIGTSTGSIIISSLNIAENNVPKYSASQVLGMYLSLSKKMITTSLGRKIFTLNGILGPKFSVSTLHDQLSERVGHTTFNSLMNRVAVTTYDISELRFNIFRSWECSTSRPDYRLADILSAATATPSIFSPVILKDVLNKKTHTYVDGLVFADDPALYGINTLISQYPNAKKYIIVRLATGGIDVNVLNLQGDKTQGWGLLSWIHPLLLIVFKSQNAEIKEAISLLQKLAPKAKFDYFVFNRDLVRVRPFDTSDENIQKILDNANAMISEEKVRLNYLVKALAP